MNDHYPPRGFADLLDRPGLVVGRSRGTTLWHYFYGPAIYAQRDPVQRQHLLDTDELGSRVAGALRAQGLIPHVPQPGDVRWMDRWRLADVVP